INREVHSRLKKNSPSRSAPDPGALAGDRIIGYGAKQTGAAGAAARYHVSVAASTPGPGPDPDGEERSRMTTTRLFLPHPQALDRRSWLKVGGLSLGALVSSPGPSLARLFDAEETAAPGGRSRRRDFAVILFWANGGPSHLETFDLKPGAP